MSIKAQVSIEYLMIMGFMMVALVPLTIVYYTHTANTGDEISSKQASQIAKRIVDTAETVYFLGKPSQKTIKVYMPSQIKNYTLGNKELIFKISIKGTVAEIVQVSSVNITGSLPTSKGIYDIVIRAEADYVDISYS